MRFIYYTIGTALGSGYAPLAPGTAGSILAAFIFFMVPMSSQFWLIPVFIFLALGVWASTKIENEKGQDPGLVVIDEVVGQWIAYLFLPVNYWILFLGFVLFRLFDIWKPYPIDKLQDLKGGWGIMADDVLAGIYANLVLQVVVQIGWIA